MLDESTLFEIDFLDLKCKACTGLEDFISDMPAAGRVKNIQCRAFSMQE